MLTKEEQVAKLQAEIAEIEECSIPVPRECGGGPTNQERRIDSFLSKRLAAAREELAKLTV